MEGKCRSVGIYLYTKRRKRERERKGGAVVGGAKSEKKEREGGVLMDWFGAGAVGTDLVL